MNNSSRAASIISAIGYSPKSQTLEVVFSNEAAYQFYNVPEELYEQLMQSGVKENYFREHIRYVYSFSRVR